MDSCLLCRIYDLQLPAAIKMDIPIVEQNTIEALYFLTVFHFIDEDNIII